MSCPTKAVYLNSYTPNLRKFAQVPARSAELSNGGDPRAHPEPPSGRVLRTEILGLLLALLLVGAVTAGLLLFDRDAALNLVPVAYLIPVILAATRWGIWPATLASIASMVAADFFFFPPIYSLQVEDPQEAIDLLLFLVVALVSSNLASRLRQETKALRRQEQEMQQLYEFSRLLAACFTISDLISAIQRYLSRALGQPATFFAARSDGHFELPDNGSVPLAVQQSVVSIMAAVDTSTRTLVDESTKNVWLLGPICSGTAVHGLVAVNIGGGSHEVVGLKTHRVEVVLEEVSLTLQRLDIEKAMADARLHLQAQLLRDAFHGTLSHELCTPLAAIRGSASVLDSMPIVRGDIRIHQLVEAIFDEAAHLDGFIQNLLNATLVTAGGVSPRLEWSDPRDIINAAIRGRSRKLAAHTITIAFAEELPLVNADSGLIAEACGQLLENAAKYSPSGSTISVHARTRQGRVIVSISDQGVGITSDDRQQLGRRSFRSQRHEATIPGSGLGFWIASIFVNANGGTIDISSRGQGEGTTASIALPCSLANPSELTDLADE